MQAAAFFSASSSVGNEQQLQLFQLLATALAGGAAASLALKVRQSGREVCCSSEGVERACRGQECVQQLQLFQLLAIALARGAAAFTRHPVCPKEGCEAV